MGRHFNEHLKQTMQLPTGARKQFFPEYFGFLGYVYSVLKYVKVMYPDVRKVDFLVERNGEVTKNLHYFWDSYETSLKQIGAVDYVGMLGDIIPGGKDRTPLQAADLLCWYVRRAQEKALEGVELERYQRLTKKQYVIGLLEDDSLTKLRDTLKTSVVRQ